MLLHRTGSAPCFPAIFISIDGYSNLLSFNGSAAEGDIRPYLVGDHKEQLSLKVPAP
jgi:hypothetical protein